MQQLMFDAVVGALDMQEVGRMCPQPARQRNISKLLQKRTFEAFSPWIQLEHVQVMLFDPVLSCDAVLQRCLLLC